MRYLGVSNWAAWQVARALGVSQQMNLTRFQSYQGYYSLAGRDMEREIVPMLETEGLGLIAYSPLAGGYLTGKYRNASEGRRATIPFPPVDEARGQRVLATMDGTATAHSVSMEAVALAWLRHRPAVSSIVLGLKGIEQLEANLAAVDLTLTDDDMRTLGEASVLPPEYPGWIIAQSSAARQTLLGRGDCRHGRDLELAASRTLRVRRTSA